MYDLHACSNILHTKLIIALKRVTSPINPI